MLRFDRQLAQPRKTLGRQIRLNSFSKPLEEYPIDVVAAKLSVSIGRDDFENPVIELENGNIERAPTEVVDRNLRTRPKPIQSVGQCRGRRLVVDPFDHKSREFTRPFGRVSLRVIEVCWNGNDGATDWTPKRTLHVLFQFFQNQRGNLFRPSILSSRKNCYRVS